MRKQIAHYVCQKCGAEFPKWQGQCTQCQKWNSLVETVVSTKTHRFQTTAHSGKAIKPLRLSEIKSKTFKRIKTNISELDRVLGAGIVPGSIVLVAGAPGIGKSTLLTQLALRVDSVLYICGEESPAQIKLRIDRFMAAKSNPLNLVKKQLDNFHFSAETNIENILTSIYQAKQNYSLIIVDSIQTLWSENLTGIAGSVGQVRYSSQMLQTLAKKTGMSVFIIGHITKEGTIAGPKVLEHLVDTVLYLEGDPDHDFRILRTSKNRFGPTDEVGIFQMGDSGLTEVKNPSDLFLSGVRKDQPGSAITISMQGIRPMPIEIQALVIPSQLAMPRRVASGIDYKRLQVLCAVIQKHLRLPLAQSDVFVSVAGGLNLREPAADLAIALAIISSVKNKPLSWQSVVLGELGLLGEIRQPSFMSKRLKEARQLGYKLMIGEKEKDLRQTLKYLQ